MRNNFRKISICLFRASCQDLTKDVYITEWVKNSWSKIKISFKDTIVRSVLKCKISNELDRSEDHPINICGLEDCKMSASEKDLMIAMYNLG